MFAIFHTLTYAADEFLAKRIIGPFPTECEAYAAASAILNRFDPEGYREALLSLEPDDVITNAKVVQAYQDYLCESLDYIHVFRLETADQLIAYLVSAEKEDFEQEAQSDG